MVEVELPNPEELEEKDAILSAERSLFSQQSMLLFSQYAPWAATTQ